MLFAFNKSSSVMTLHSISNQFSCTFAVVTKLCQMNEFGLDNFVENPSQIKVVLHSQLRSNLLLGFWTLLRPGSLPQLQKYAEYFSKHKQVVYDIVFTYAFHSEDLPISQNIYI